jgi:hypothetical protein
MALTDNILAYWNLNDDGSGAVSLVDSTGNGNTLTNNNGVTLGTGIIAGDASFDGSVGPLLTSSPVLSSGGSLSYWLKLTSDGFYQCPISQWQSGGWKFGLTGGNVLYFYTGSAYYFNATGVADGNWHNVVVTDDGSGNLSFYFDGQLDGTSSFGSINFSKILSIGADVAGNEKITGGVDEVGVWNRELTSGEVTFLYNSGSGLTYPFNGLYYNAAVNTDWGTLGNWWNDPSFTLPASALPDNTNPVFIYADVLENTAGDGVCYCASAEFYSASFYSPLVLNSTGLVNFNGTGGVFDGTATDGISFHDTCSLGENGIVTGNATFRDSSYSFGHVGGNANVYYDNDQGSYPIGGTVTGSVSYLGWPAVQDQYFNDDVSGSGAAGNWQDIANWWANDSFTTRPINSVGTQELPDAGTNIYLYAPLNAYNTSSTINVNRARFYGSSYLNTPITLNVSINVYFYNSSGTQGTIYGDCYFYNNSYFYSNYGDGFTHGSIYFYDNSGVYQELDGYNIATGGIYIYSLNALKNSFGYKFGFMSDGVVYNIPSSGGGGGLISRLLNLPWFINI